jgi:hypothetical protein
MSSFRPPDMLPTGDVPEPEPVDEGGHEPEQPPTAPPQPCGPVGCWPRWGG